MVVIPTSIACAHCGKPLHCLTCFSVSVPEESRIRPSDFCGLPCLAAWTADVAHLATGKRRRQ